MVEKESRKMGLWLVTMVESRKMKEVSKSQDVIISFSKDDYPPNFNKEDDDTMFIKAIIDNYSIKETIIDQGCLVNILYGKIMAKLNITKSKLKPYCGNLIRF